MLGAGLIFFLAALQGLTELFPVSTLGHAVDVVCEPLDLSRALGIARVRP